MSIEQCVAGLNGYLKALQRMRGSNFAFGARYFSSKEELDQFIFRVTTDGAKHIELDYKAVVSKLESIIFKGVLDKSRISNEEAWSYIHKMTIEDIIDFYELIPFSENEVGDKNSLFDAPIYSLTNAITEDKASFLFWLKAGNKYVFTYFRHLKPDFMRSPNAACAQESPTSL